MFNYAKVAQRCYSLSGMKSELACTQRYEKVNHTSHTQAFIYIINYLAILTLFKILMFIILLPTFMFNKNRKLNFTLKIVTTFFLGKK